MQPGFLPPLLNTTLLWESKEKRPEEMGARGKAAEMGGSPTLKQLRNVYSCLLALQKVEVFY